MLTDEKIHSINKVLFEYFTNNKANEPVLAKHFMNEFIKAGIFPTDLKQGLQIRTLLRELDRTNQLHLIPFVFPVRKNKNTNWFFAPANVNLTRIVIDKTPHAPTKRRQSVTKSRCDSDELYVLDLCDEVLHLNSARQHKFPFLVGDPNSNGKCKELPVDGWYEQLNLVIEYNEEQHTNAVPHFDKPMTISGIPRREQRNRYDQRRREVLKEKGIRMVVFSYSEFEHNSRKRLKRNRDNDITIVRSKLNQYTKTIK